MEFFVFFMPPHQRLAKNIGEYFCFFWGQPWRGRNFFFAASGGGLTMAKGRRPNRFDLLG
jgi:hypothetical protein